MSIKSIVIVAITALSIVGIYSCSNESKNKEKEKHKVPAFDVSSIDSTVNPCDDFDQFVNGNWKKNNPIPSTEGSWGAFEVLDKETREVKIKSVILDLLKEENVKKGSDVQLIVDYYRSYLDTITIEKRGISPLLPLTDKITKSASLNELVALMGELEKYNVAGFAGTYIGPDDRNSNMNAVFTVQSGLSMGDRNYYENPDSSMQVMRNEFVKHIDKMFLMAEWPDKNPGESILGFETKLALMQLKNFELRDPVKTYNKIAFTELNKLAPAINWSGYYQNFGVKTDSLIVQDKNYLKNVNNLLKVSPLELVKTYYKWQLLTAYANMLSADFSKESFRFYGTVMGGAKEQRKREERAVQSVNNRLGTPLGKLFVAKYFPESSKKKVSEMIENVRVVFGERINQLTWMSDSTKQKARTKLAAFTYKIGYPDKWKDYSSIDINADKLVENVMNVALWKHQDMIAKTGKPVDRSEWLLSPQTINAYYYTANNEVVFPAAILQPPFFNPDADDAINYGSIIGVIGHEFTHGFDDQGSQYDEKGNLNNWWLETDRKNFDELGAKYTKYFDGIEALKGFNINGKLTLGENIADLGGLTLGYYALEKSLQGKEKPANIDGFTYKQRFFLGWAQVWHENITDESLINQVQTNPHSPARWRVNGPLKHMKEFAESWNCTSGKMILPEQDRVVIW